MNKNVVFFGPILDVVTKTLKCFVNKPTCCVSCNQDPILVLDSQDWSACHIRSPTSQPGVLFFSILWYWKFSKIFRNFSWIFTKKKQFQNFPNFLVESPQKFVKRKKIAHHTQLLSSKNFLVSKVCIKNVKPKLCLYYILNQRHTHTHTHTHTYIYIYMIKQHFKDIV